MREFVRCKQIKSRALGLGERFPWLPSPRYASHSTFKSGFCQTRHGTGCEIKDCSKPIAPRTSLNCVKEAAQGLTGYRLDCGAFQLCRQ